MGEGTVSRKVAVVGAGASGLSAAYWLRHDAEVTVFEADARLGGHACTVEVPEGGRTLGLDTAFIVFNEPNYPELTKLFSELGVRSIEHPGRFSYYDVDDGTCYVSDDFLLNEEEVRATCPPRFLPLWREARRFHQEAPRDFVRGRVDMSLGDYLDRNGYSDGFRYGFVVMMCSTAWVVPADKIWEMPAATIIAFFMAHGAEPLGGSGLPWRTVLGGSISYVRRVAEELTAAGARISLSTPVRAVRAEAGGATVRTDEGEFQFDQVVVATHADQALNMLERPTGRQRLLETITYHQSKSVLHTDTSIMPRERSRWRSWNYGLVTRGGEPNPWVVYHLNQLHDIDSDSQYLVSVECPLPLRDEAVIEEITFRHPTFTQQAREIQRDLRGINTTSPIKFAGSYFHSRKFGPDSVGNHDTAIGSGVTAAEHVRRDLAALPATAM